MADKTLYLKLQQKIKTGQKEIHLQDIGKVYCIDENIMNRVKTIKVYRFREKGDSKAVISVMKIIELIQQVYPNVTIESIGETDTIIEWITKQKPSNFKKIFKVILVSLVCFFGTMLSIMAFHNDVGISQLFMKVYEMVIGQPSSGYSILEFSYSIGLAAGIFIFFNHVGKRRITKDPTPVEVEMRLYENDVNTSLIEIADREEKTIDVS